MRKMICFLPEATNSGSAKSIAVSLKALSNSGIIEANNIAIYYHAMPFAKKKIRHDLQPYASKGTLLPYLRVYKGTKLSYWGWVREAISLIAFAIYWFLYLRFSLSRNEIVYINSISLFPILWFLPKETQAVMHVREQFNTIERPTLSRIAINLIKKRANHIIAIDLLTKAPFDNLAKCQQISNGFSMENARGMRAQSESLRSQLGIPNTHVASMIGIISEAKGSHRFLELCLLMSNNPEWHFVAVGRRYDTTGDNMRKYANTHSNLTLIDEIEDIDKIYAISDFIVRCEDYLPLGRTVWEGLYAGCKIVIPTRQNDKLDDLEIYLDKGIWSYPAGDVKAMANTLLNIMYVPDQTDIPCSNISEHTKRMSLIFNSLITNTAETYH